MKLVDNTILITGGTSGIGLSLAIALSEKNTVIIASRRECKIEEITKEYHKIVGYTVDVSDIESVEILANILLDRYPKLNMVINSAGIMRAVNFFDQKSEITSETAINLNGTININKVFLPTLAKNGESAMINISSGLSYIASTAHPRYSATKSAVNALTDAIRGQAKYYNYNRLHIIQVAPPLIAETNLNPIMHENNNQNIVNMSLDQFTKSVLVGIRKNKQIINPGPSQLLYLIGKFIPSRLKIKIMQRTMVAEFGENK